MKIGTKSLLYGAHQFALHPLFVALAWRRLYGLWPRDLRIWLAFAIHDWGYWGCPNMDGAEGKMHPWPAAKWITRWIDCKLRADGWPWLPTRWITPTEATVFELLDRYDLKTVYRGGQNAALGRLDAAGHRIEEDQHAPLLGPWGRFCLFHSRSLARRYGEPVSRLCAPDKVASFLMPRWLYITLTRWTGELEEYMAEADTPAGRAQDISIESPEAWFDSVKKYLDGVAEQIVAGGDPGVPPTRSESLHGGSAC